MSAPTLLDDRRAGVALFLISFAVLVAEVAATRILSVVLWYHWAFLCVSLAMLGLGVPGVWLAFAREPMRHLERALVAAALLLPASVVTLVKVVPWVELDAAVVAMAALLAPLLALGTSVGILLLQGPPSTLGRRYAWDLAGAGAGALAVVPLLYVLPTPTLMAGLGFLPLAAGAVVRGRPSPAALAAGALLAVALAWGEPFALRANKSYVEEGARTPVLEVWTPTARLTFFDDILFIAQTNAGFAWGRGRGAPLVPTDQYWMEQDGSAGTPLTRFSGTREGLASLGWLLDDVTFVGAELRRPATAAVIGAGGGRDVLACLVLGASRVDAVELNGEVVRQLRTRFREFTGDVYGFPGVRAVVDEGRSFLSRTDERYDLVLLSLVDSWAATAAGAYSLAENDLYTVEALRLYLRRLAPGGRLSACRWLYGPSWPEGARLSLMALEALTQEGAAEPRRHLAVVRGGRVGTVLVAREPFGDEELARLRELCARRGFDLQYPTPPGATPSRLATILAGGAAASGLDARCLEPSTDDRPFFFQLGTPFAPVSDDLARRLGVNVEGVQTLRLVMACLAVATLTLFFLPFVLPGRLGTAPGLWRASCYFLAIGVAFMFVEIPWLHRMVLFLGHPSYATTVVLAALLTGAGAGAALAGRAGPARAARFLWVVPLALAGAVAAMPPVLAAAHGLAFWLRCLVAAALVAPAGVGMGLFFPLGMARFHDGRAPWYWALNGAASVLASALALALSMEFGFSAVALTGALFYVAACALLRGPVSAPPGAAG